MGTPNEALAVAFDAERPHLLSVASRILGSSLDAHDVVQEAWWRFSNHDLSEIDNPQAWLTTAVTRLSIDQLRRSRRTAQPVAEADLRAAAEAASPEDIVVLADELTEAFTVVLDSLTPEQRVALILHDVFAMPFDEVAHVLGTTPGSAKKLASRARGRLRSDQGYRLHSAAELMAARRVVDAFLHAAQQGDVATLVNVLHPEVTRTADPQAIPPGALRHLAGVAAVVQETRALRENARTAHLTTILGRPGIAVVHDGAVTAALVIDVVDGRIHRYHVVADPHRLSQLHIEDGAW